MELRKSNSLTYCVILVLSIFTWCKTKVNETSERVRILSYHPPPHSAYRKTILNLSLPLNLKMHFHFRHACIMFNIVVYFYRQTRVKKDVSSPCVSSSISSFYNNVGVWQGENLSPFLFALYLNNLKVFRYSNNVKNLSRLSEKLGTILNIYSKLFLFLHANDTILLSEIPEESQNQLDVFIFEYC